MEKDQLSRKLAVILNADKERAEICISAVRSNGRCNTCVNLSDGVSNRRVLRGRSYNCRAIALSLS